MNYANIRNEIIQDCLNLKAEACLYGYDYPLGHNTFEDFDYLSRYELRQFRAELRQHISYNKEYA